MPPIDLSGTIPPEYARQIITEASESSVVLQLATKVPMGTKTMEFPVPASFPEADWVATPGGRKPVTGLSLSSQTLRAEELAAIIYIADEFIEDSTFDLWGYARPLLADAFANKLDNSVLWGVGAPASFPAGGVAAAATVVPEGADALDTVNNVFSAVETQGVEVTGAAASLPVKGVLRGVRDGGGALLLGTTQADQRSIDTLYGVPIAYRPFSPDAPGNLIAGGWRYLIIGVRQDLRYRFSTEATLQEGDTIRSLFQENLTALKVWARYGCVLARPVTAVNPDEPADPFAITTLTGANPTPTPPDGGTGGAASASVTRAGRTPAAAGRR